MYYYNQWVERSSFWQLDTYIPLGESVGWTVIVKSSQFWQLDTYIPLGEGKAWIFDYIYYCRESVGCITIVLLFFVKFLENRSPFCGATDTPVLYFCWRLLWVWKPESAAFFILGRGVLVKVCPHRESVAAEASASPLEYIVTLKNWFPSVTMDSNGDAVADTRCG